MSCHLTASVFLRITKNYYAACREISLRWNLSFDCSTTLRVYRRRVFRWARVMSHDGESRELCEPSRGYHEKRHLWQPSSLPKVIYVHEIEAGKPADCMCNSVSTGIFEMRQQKG